MERVRRRILIVDDHPIFREGLRLLLEALGYEVAGEASDGLMAIQCYRTHRPDVTIMDLQMRGYSGLFGLEQIIACDSEACIILLSMHEGDEDIWRGLAAGARAYILKGGTKEELTTAIEAVAVGRRYLPSDVGTKLAERLHASPLSIRENEVLALLAEGLSNAEIGLRLGISQGTVKSHVYALTNKLGVSNRAGALAVAQRRGLLGR